MTNKASLSIIIPLLNEEKNIGPLYQKLKEVLAQHQHEVIYVNDGSTDKTSSLLGALSKKDPSVNIITFRKNFGKSAAYSAGFAQAKGDIVITMDGDLQDDPADIPSFLQKIDAGYDLVVGWKKKKYQWYDPKMIPSAVFNMMTRTLTGIKLHDIDCPFKAFTKDVVKQLSIYGELHRYIPILVHEEGFRIGEVSVKNLPRRFGATKYGFTRIIKGSLDLITVFFITRFIKRPLHFFGSLGLVFLLGGTLLGLALAVRRFIFGILILKEAYILFAIFSIILGVQFISLGLIGEMINLSIIKQSRK